MLKKFIIAAALTLAALAPASAHHEGEVTAKHGIKVSHGWTVATASMSDGIEVYMTMWNEGETTDKLVGAELPFADDAVIQAQSISEDGELEMRDLKAVNLKPGQAITMHPQGVHLVFNNVQRVLRAGDSFHAHLEFAKAGEVEVEITVMAPDHAKEMM
ncbi:copper chaperone PCu(A)C [Rhodovibrio salinarum]|uniref:Copper chaperone PCu(A)C n=1 Tax=Rhodovibrio salinarum TaxID=1087 RepID=A0A934QGY8_9PROT|nr:copper chaperone PCu(A)C [Rhodovibrio salinarum]MBK1696467.1 copper chaperone PCu(A)C [Rhodovibrio salinarum]